MSSPSDGTPPDDVVRLVTALLDPAGRPGARRALAARLGAEDLLVLVLDREVGLPIPAPGFPQTLRDGSGWRAFLAECARAGAHSADLPIDDRDRPSRVAGIAAPGGSYLVLVGGSPEPHELEAVRPLVPLLAASLVNEQVAQIAEAHAAASRQSAAEACALAESLDRARRENEALARDNARLYQEARATLRARDEFLSIASHELKTPIATLKGSVQLMLRTQARGQLDPARLSRYLRMLENASDRLAVLITDLLEVSGARLGYLPLRPRQFDFVELVRRVASCYQEWLADDHPVVMKLPDNLPVVADPYRIEQVLVHLVENAAKYSPPGSHISIGLDRLRDGLLLRVEDQGIGLPPGAAEAIFEPFTRAENARRQHLPGLGLGLHICRQIVERHGGRVWAESAGEHCGTTFHVWLPPGSNLTSARAADG